MKTFGSKTQEVRIQVEARDSEFQSCFWLPWVCIKSVRESVCSKKNRVVRNVHT